MIVYIALLQSTVLTIVLCTILVFHIMFCASISLFGFDIYSELY